MLPSKTTSTIPQEKATEVFKLLSDKTRFKILYLLHQASDGMCVHEIADELGISHSATSHQLSKLEDKGVVKGYREGQSMCYRLTQGPLTKKLTQLIELFT